MTIRYQAFADGEILTADDLLDLQKNGVIQVTAFSELAALDNEVNAAYVENDGAFYVRKLDSSWGQVGGLAQVGASAPVSPQVGQIWYDTDATLPDPIKQFYSGGEQTTNTNMEDMTTSITPISLTLPESAIVQVAYGATAVNGLDSDGQAITVRLSGATTRTPTTQDYSYHQGNKKSTITNQFTVIVNAGTTLFTMQHLREGSGTVNTTNPWMEVTPIRWA